MTKYPWLIKDIKKHIPKLKKGFINISQIARLISEKRGTTISRALVTFHLQRLWIR